VTFCNNRGFRDGILHSLAVETSNLKYYTILKPTTVRVMRTTNITVALLGSAVGMATGYGLDGRRVWSSNPGRVKNVHFSLLSRPALKPPNLVCDRSLGLFLMGLNRLVREADQSPPNNAEGKNTWICTTTTPYVLMA
jgi:hypothetical protein